MEALLRRFPGLAGFPRVDLGVRPTPVEARAIAGVPLLVKRDDATCAEYGGNKPRALELWLALPARRLLTVSTLHAHHAYATALFGARLGLPTDAVLVRRGVPGETLARLRAVAARVIEVGGGAGAVACALSLWRPGTRFIPPGGASARGAIGYLAAAFELPEVPPRIYVALGSGATVSGLLAGLALLRARCELVAVRAADRIAAWPPLLWARARRTVALLRRHDPSLPRADRSGVALRVVDGGGAYGEATPEALAAVRAAADAGLVLEPTYTGRALAVALRERVPGALFWNTYCPLAGAAAGPPVRERAPAARPR
jgi:D-cysteine desulfhydrase